MSCLSFFFFSSFVSSFFLLFCGGCLSSVSYFLAIDSEARIYSRIPIVAFPNEVSAILGPFAQMVLTSLLTRHILLLSASYQPHKSIFKSASFGLPVPCGGIVGPYLCTKGSYSCSPRLGRIASCTRGLRDTASIFIFILVCFR